MTAAYGFFHHHRHDNDNHTNVLFYALCEALAGVAGYNRGLRISNSWIFSSLVANAVKILHRLFFVLFEVGLFFTMYIWFRARKINNCFLTFVDLKEQIPILHALSADTSVLAACNASYLSNQGQQQQADRTEDHLLYI